MNHMMFDIKVKYHIFCEVDNSHHRHSMLAITSNLVRVAFVLI